MKKLARVVSVILVVLSLGLSLSGCWSARELNTLNIVMGVGIDKTKDSNGIQMTTQIVNLSKSESSSGKGGGGGGIKTVNLTSTGPDPFSIIREYTHSVNRRLYLPHTQVIIFGEGFATEGVRDNLDFFLRDHELRMTVNVLVAKGSAKDILEAEPEYLKIPAADITEIIKAQRVTSETASLNVGELMTLLTSKTSAAVAPIIEVKKEQDKQHYIVSGGAVIKDGKLVGELDKTQTRGMRWVENKVKGCLLTVNVKDQKAVIEIRDSKSKVKSEVKDDGTIVLKIKIIGSGDIGSQTGSENFATIENIPLLEEAAENVIAEEIQSSLNKAIELDADIFGFGEKIKSEHPKAWKKVGDDWDEAFKNIQVEIDVTAKIHAVGSITKTCYQ